jgi:hypothetical protein
MGIQNAINCLPSANISGGTTNQVVYQTGLNTTGFVTNGGQSILGSNGSNVPTWQTSVPTSQIPYDTNNFTSSGGNLTCVNTYNVIGGGANQIITVAVNNSSVGFSQCSANTVFFDLIWESPTVDNVVTFASGISTSNSVSSHTATTAFGTSMTIGTAVQNNTAYDMLVNMAIVVSSATSATISLGVDSTNTPTAVTAIPTFSTASTVTYMLSAYVPSSWYLKITDSGTITVSSITSWACPL